MDLAPESSQVSFCSTLSLETGEQLFGTASRAEAFLLLEYNGPWESKAFEQSDLTQAVKDHLSSYKQNIPGLTILLIRSRERSGRGGWHPPWPGIHFYVVSVKEDNPSLHAFQLAGYADLLDVDIQAVLSGGQAYRQYQDFDPLILVCTNGKRDPCCAKFGPSLFRQLLKLEPGRVWQCSHVGGHRFAANAVCLPHGIFLGRLRAGDAQQVLDAYHQGEILLDHYRGRACYAEVVQAADYYLRRETGILDIASFHFLEAEESDSDIWNIRFQDIKSGKIHQLRIARETSGVKIYQSCNSDKFSSLIRYYLVDYLV